MRLTRAAAAEDDGRQVVWTVGRQHPASVVLKVRSKRQHEEAWWTPQRFPRTETALRSSSLSQDEDWELYASRQHASFVFDVPSSRFSLVALPDATNGTFVNDVKVRNFSDTVRPAPIKLWLCPFLLPLAVLTTPRHPSPVDTETARGAA